MVQVQLNVDDEIKALADALAIAIVDVKAKKPIAQDLTDVAAKLIPALASLQNVQVDIKKGDNQAYVVKALSDALSPQVVA